MTRAQSGEGRAFSELVARYQERIYRFLLRLTRSAGDARDLTQETFIHAYQAKQQWRPEAAFSSWLFRIARNQAFDLLRRARHTEFVALDDDASIPDPASAPEQVFEIAERFRMLDRALARLPVDHREILLLREIEELSYDEIAAVLGLSLGTVKSRIARARAALLEKMPYRLEET